MSLNKVSQPTEQEIERVPGKAHYGLGYLDGGRIFSYAHQIDAIRRLEARSVVEVGPGPGLVTAALRAMGVEVTTVDVQPELEPDVIASVLELPFEDRCFDAALCCQVLEHLPFENFVPALKELKRVTRNGVVISLPDASPHYAMRVRLPKVPRVDWTGTRRRDPGGAWKKEKLDTDGHYWEIGYEGIDYKNVVRMAERALGCLATTWRVSEKYYHRFVMFCPIAKQDSRARK